MNRSIGFLGLLGACTTAAAACFAGDGNRLAYLDAFCNPYWPGLNAARLETPQWVGEAGVEAVVTIGIDDMRDTAPYEDHLRPVLGRLRQVDGRAPVSIMTNEIDPRHPRLQSWLDEGLSIETHTADHPCPCLAGGDFDRAKDTYDRCVDQMFAIPGNRPVAFRFPCMDSLNTPSPRGFAEIVNQTTPAGNFLQLSSSVCTLFTSDDPSLPRDLVFDPDGQERFRKYIPFPSFVNLVHNYPYPYVIDRLCWEFPCAIPDDWQGQNLNGVSSHKTAEDYRAVIDAAVIKRGTANLVCHPNNWIGQQLLLEVVDETIKKHGPQIRFLTFRECVDRLNKNLLAGQPIRAANGQDNGVRILDVNHDGYVDVVIGNEHLRQTRTWQPQSRTWRTTGFPVAIVNVTAEGDRFDTGVRFGVLQATGQASFVVANEVVRGVWHFDGQQWVEDEHGLEGLQMDGSPVVTTRQQADQGVRLRDIDGDGGCELIVANPRHRAVFRWVPTSAIWESVQQAVVPEPIVTAAGRDAGFRFVDLNRDGHDDIVFSDDQRYSSYLFTPRTGGWNQQKHSRTRQGEAAEIPAIVRGGRNNGAWFAGGHLWLQNEHTDRLPDGVDRRTFAQLLGESEPASRTR